MKKMILYLAVGIIIEAITFNFGMVRYVESFYFVWGALYLGTFLLTLFRVDTSTYTILNIKSAEKLRNSEDITVERNKIKSVKVFPSVLLFLAIMCVSNVALFLYLMPK